MLFLPSQIVSRKVSFFRSYEIKMLSLLAQSSLLIEDDLFLIIRG